MKVKTLDLFCGAGGSSWGAHMAGAEIVMGIDLWERAIATYSENFKGPDGKGAGRVLEMTPDTVPSDLGLSRGAIDLLLASPECTNHTCAKGSRVRSEESKRTANYVLNFARDLEPRWVVIENVVHMKNWHGYRPLLDGLQELGYGFREQTLDASKYGVPQTRRRLFVVAEKGRIPDPITPRGEQEITAREILDYDASTGVDRHRSRPLLAPKRAQPTIDRFHRGVSALGPGVPFLLVYYGSDAAGGWQSLDRPLRTLTTLDRFGLVTWKGDVPYLRMLQVPELRRAMGWREDMRYVLTGSRREQIKQLGNGVAPPVMTRIVESLIQRADELSTRRPARPTP